MASACIADEMVHSGSTFTNDSLLSPLGIRMSVKDSGDDGLALPDDEEDHEDDFKDDKDDDEEDDFEEDEFEDEDVEEEDIEDEEFDDLDDDDDDADEGEF